MTYLGSHRTSSHSQAIQSNVAARVNLLTFQLATGEYGGGKEGGKTSRGSKREISYPAQNPSQTFLITDLMQMQMHDYGNVLVPQGHMGTRWGRETGRRKGKGRKGRNREDR